MNKKSYDYTSTARRAKQVDEHNKMANSLGEPTAARLLTKMVQAWRNKVLKIWMKEKEGNINEG